MTKLTQKVRRMTDAVVRDGARRRALVVTIYPNDTIGLRPAKTRREELLPLSAVYELAIRLRVRTEKRERKAKKGRR